VPEFRISENVAIIQGNLLIKPVII
jgi:hypothetical protein